MKYLKLMRVKHYIKNGLIFLPLVFSGMFFNTRLLVETSLGFLSFCFLSSTIYILNDIRDVENDQNHPTKCKRPIACGAVSIQASSVLAFILFSLSMICNFIIGPINYAAWGILALYFIINCSYSLGLKNIPILDIALLVSGFLLRTLYGAIITDIRISNWLYLTVVSVSFYLGLGKRRNELMHISSLTTRGVLQYYNRDFFDKNMYQCLTLAVVFYSLWTVDPTTMQHIGSGNLIWTVPFVIILCMRYSLIVEGDSDGDPIEVFYKDKPLIIMALLYSVVMMAVIYI